jgi:hypothetical protein
MLPCPLLQREGSLLDEIMAQTRLAPNDESYAVARRGVEAFIAELLEPKTAYDKADKRAVDQMIAEIDRKLSQQIDEILHHKDVQQLESAWRGLKFVVNRTDFRESNKIELLNISKQQLLEDFEDSPEVVRSGLYKLAYTAEYGQFGGEPYAAMIANYDFGRAPRTSRCCKTWLASHRWRTLRSLRRLVRSSSGWRTTSKAWRTSRTWTRCSRGRSTPSGKHSGIRGCALRRPHLSALPVASALRRRQSSQGV